MRVGDNARQMTEKGVETENYTTIKMPERDFRKQRFVNELKSLFSLNNNGRQ